MGAGQNQRSIEYDTVDDTYARYVLEEVLPEIGKQVKLRQDAYSRAMVGESSGGICAFNAAFHTPPAEPNILWWCAAGLIRIFECGCKMEPKIWRMPAPGTGRRQY
ncbi:MAG TPA: alpha/beta hydrolase-fold protein [Bryobacteraceae bacterium]